MEYYAYLRSVQTLDSAHVAIVVADATVRVGELDVTISTRPRDATAPRSWP